MTMLWFLRNYCRTKQLILFWFVTLFIVQQDIASPTEKLRDYELCKEGETLTNYALRGGKKAGHYYKIGQAANLEECVALCCSSEPEDCHLAIFVKNSCYSVECKSADLCKPIKVPENSVIHSSIFRRHGANFFKDHDSSFQLPDISGSNITLKREKRFGSCRHYTGKTCKAYLDIDRSVYYDEPHSVVEHRLSGPFGVIEGHFKPSCKKYALPALCLTSFPYCESKPHPQPIYLCREDCERLYSDVCKHDFNLAKRVAKKYPPLLKIMPNCSNLIVPSNEGDDCVKLGLSEDNGRVLTTISTPKMTTDITGHDYKSVLETKPTIPIKQPETVLATNKTPSEDIQIHHTNAHGNLLRTKLTTPYRTIIKHPEDEITPSQTSQPVLSVHPSNIYRVETNKEELDTDSTKLSKHLELETAKTTPNLASTSHQINGNDGVEIKQSNAKTENPIELPTRQPVTTTSNSNLGVKESVQPTINTSTEASPIHIGHKSKGELSKESVNTRPKTGLKASKNIKLNKTIEIPEKDKTFSPDMSFSSPSTISPTNVNSRSPLSLLSSVFSSSKPQSVGEDRPTVNVSNDSISPTIINTNVSQDALELEAVTKESKKVVVPATKQDIKLITTKAPGIQLHVSTVGDTEILLPKDTASLYASAWPKESLANPYTYQWLQLAAPKNSHGYMEGKNEQRVVLTQLTKPGIYQFKVIVRGKHHQHGNALVNVTVKERQRINKPPRADVSPKEQSITLPTNEVVLDGSKSSDDKKIVEYKWQELKGPLTEKDKTIKSGVDSPVLQLKSLLPGVYTYKLTVKDSDGETDSVMATVTVNAEKDYPPVARAGNDVITTLPVNYVTLYGNGSTDDHGVKSYEWSKSPLSPPCDLQGTTEPILRVSNMVEGDYMFTLKVTDTGDHSSESKVTVVVRPEKNSSPVANAGDDKDLVYPDDSTILNAKDSHDDQGISRYHWEKISGPSSVQMNGVDKMILSLSHLTEGHYLFKLTVYDNKGLTGTDTVFVNVKRDGNKPPHADAGPDVLVKLPNRAAALDGSKSSDDYGIIQYSWTRDMKSPAAGDVVNGSHHQSILRLSNLVKGVYRFRLTVKDVKGLESYDEAKVIVKEDENSPNLIELYLDVDIRSFTEENKRQLIRKLAVYLNVMDGDIVVEHIQPSGRGNSLVVLFYVKDSLTKSARDGKEIADLLKQKLRDNFFEFRMEEVEPYVCRNNCSGHGYCDQHTKQCICESFWMQDPFKAHFGLRDRNCDWSILYVIVIIFGVIVAIVGITWGVCFCLGRTKTRQRRNQYSIVNDEDSDDAKNATMELFPRGKYMNSSIMSETDMDTDEETLFENQKPYKGSRPKLNGMINGTKNHHT